MRRTILKHYPDSTVTSFRLGSLLSYTGSPKEGLTYLIKAHQYEDKGIWNSQLCYTYERLKDRENAIFHIKKALEHDPNEGLYITKLMALEKGELIE